MKRINLLVFLTLFGSLILSGCQSNDSNEGSNKEISKVNVSNSLEFGKVNANLFVVYEDEETLELFQNAITNNVRLDGIVDLSEPEYDLEIIFSNGNKEGYHLWVGEKGQTSNLMKVNDTHTVYSISAEMTNQFIDLFK